ncbi:MAG: small multi-drug export protein, partial [Clostridiales bacterium]|nr:small multi-drug export protein [Clostridiales bacterium]
MMLLQLPPFLEVLGDTAPGRVLVTFFLSMVPVVELRGGIPAGVLLGLPPLAAACIAIAGNIVPVPFIILFIRYIFDWMKHFGGFPGKIATKLENRANNKSGALARGELIGLTILVAIPLPGTGAWTGALVAAMLGMRMKR